MTARFWLYTVWKLDISESEFSSLTNNVDFKYVTWQVEAAPDTGRHHVQLYVEFKRPQRITRFPRLVELRPGEWHGERVRSRERSRAYCQKEDTRVDGPWEIGTWDADGPRGRRSDLAALADDVLSPGVRVSDIARSRPEEFIRYHRGIERLHTLTHQPDRAYHRKSVVLLVGPTGCGKTRWAYDNYGDELYCPAFHGSTLWLDGYEGERVCLLDDYRKDSWSIDSLLRFLDGYQARWPIKGGHTVWKGEVVVITSNVKPAGWYPYQDVQPLLRRITHFVEYDEDTGKWIWVDEKVATTEEEQARFADISAKLVAGLHM